MAVTKRETPNLDFRTMHSFHLSKHTVNNMPGTGFSSLSPLFLVAAIGAAVGAITLKGDFVWDDRVFVLTQEAYWRFDLRAILTSPANGVDKAAAAIEPFSVAVNRDAAFLEGFYHLGKTYERLGHNEEAISTYNRLLASKGIDFGGYRELAREAIRRLSTARGAGRPEQPGPPPGGRLRVPPPEAGHGGA